MRESNDTDLDNLDYYEEVCLDIYGRIAALVDALEYIRQNTDCSLARQWATAALKKHGGE